jgi:hypothetical protein
MAEGDGFIYNNFKEQVMEAQFNLASGGDSIKVILVNAHTPDIDTHTQYSDVSSDEYSTGLGYTVTGDVLAGQDVIQDNTNDRGEFDATDLTWSSLGTLSPATPSHAIMYDDTHGSDLLIAYWVLGTTATNGGDYTLQWGTNGIILLT